mmetsp:Transcript_16072/g.31070  ORF Transcript_16072/g.31070 Transcript_16072/m.31070 type:complete len:318 (-) Transcript_16072:327-1280(-)
MKGCGDILKERGVAVLALVNNADSASGLREGSKKVGCGPRAHHTHAEHTDALAREADSGRSAGNHDGLGIRGARVLEETSLGAADTLDAGIKGVCNGGQALKVGEVGADLSEVLDGAKVNVAEAAGKTSSVPEVNDGGTLGLRDDVSDNSEVVDLLHRGSGKNGKASLAHGHHITEVSGHATILGAGSGRDVEHNAVAGAKTIGADGVEVAGHLAKHLASRGDSNTAALLLELGSGAVSTLYNADRGHGTAGVRLESLLPRGQDILGNTGSAGHIDTGLNEDGIAESVRNMCCGLATVHKNAGNLVTGAHYGWISGL